MAVIVSYVKHTQLHHIFFSREIVQEFKKHIFLFLLWLQASVLKF